MLRRHTAQPRATPAMQQLKRNKRFFTTSRLLSRSANLSKKQTKKKTKKQRPPTQRKVQSATCRRWKINWRQSQQKMTGAHAHTNTHARAQRGRWAHTHKQAHTHTRISIHTQHGKGSNLPNIQASLRRLHNHLSINGEAGVGRKQYRVTGQARASQHNIVEVCIHTHVHTDARTREFQFCF